MAYCFVGRIDPHKTAKIMEMALLRIYQILSKYIIKLSYILPLLKNCEKYNRAPSQIGGFCGHICGHASASVRFKFLSAKRESFPFLHKSFPSFLNQSVSIQSLHFEEASLSGKTGLHSGDEKKMHLRISFFQSLIGPKKFIYTKIKTNHFH